MVTVLGYLAKNQNSEKFYKLQAKLLVEQVIGHFIIKRGWIPSLLQVNQMSPYAEQQTSFPSVYKRSKLTLPELIFYLLPQSLREKIKRTIFLL
jgi:hypothetical protein